jgi:acetyl esterase
MALDEATTALLARLAEQGGRPLHEMTPVAARELVATMRADVGPGPEMTAVRDARVTVSGGYIPVRILRPVERPRGVIVYYHGGGWVLGGVAESDALGRRLAQRTGCVVVLVGYRLAPEYRYPTAVDDSWAALRWTERHRAELAGRDAPLVVAGESAGGNLAAVLTHRARAAGGPAIALQVLVYPVTDCDFESISYTDPANQVRMTRETMMWFWDQYVPEPAARVHPEASPLRVPDFHRLPPAVVLTAEHDVLRDEGELYATQLMRARVPVRHHRFTGQMHGFLGMIDSLPGSAAGLDYIVATIEEQWAGERVTV